MEVYLWKNNNKMPEQTDSARTKKTKQTNFKYYSQTMGEQDTAT